MRFRFFLLVVFVFCFSKSALSFSKDSTQNSFFDLSGIHFGFGLTGGMSQNGTFLGDMYYRCFFSDGNLRNFAPNIGYSFFSDKLDYVGNDDLYFGSHGLFVGMNYYLLPNLYVGGKLACTINVLTSPSQEEWESYEESNVPYAFLGMAMYAHVGCYLPFEKNIGLKLQAQAGFHIYRIMREDTFYYQANGDKRDDQLSARTYNDLLYNLSIGVLFNF